MRRAVREQFDVLAAELDRLDDQCGELDMRVRMGRKLTAAEQVQYMRWVQDGRRAWRRKQKLVRRLRKTARMCTRNVRRGRMKT